MTVHVIAYGSGNIRSVLNAFHRIGVSARVVESPSNITDAGHLVLPGVGAFSAAMEILERDGWADAIRGHVVAGRPLLGICLGMQLLASHGEEGGLSGGLDFIRGRVVRLERGAGLDRIPHVGWNDVSLSRDSRLLDGVPSGSDFYFSHSYTLLPEDDQTVVAVVGEGVAMVAAVESGPVHGVQFHPEKSSQAGLRVLENFAGM
jgi:glutamine amidotransferase